MKNKLATPVLIACALFIGMDAGALLYDHMFGIPEFFKSPAAFIGEMNNDLGKAPKFWLPLYVLMFITLVSSLIFNWKNQGRKKLLLWVFIGYIYNSAVSIYFVKNYLHSKICPMHPNFISKQNSG